MAISQHRVPVELFREIVSHIDDTPTLAIVALVCQFLLHEARRQLYTSVSPRDTRSVLQHLHLFRTLVERPCVSSLVTSFHSSEVIQVYETPLWDLLYRALRQMPNLKRLHFRSFGAAPCGGLLLDCPFQLEYLHWGNVCEGADLFNALRQQHKLRYLHLECDSSETQPPDVCPRLEILEGNFASMQTFLPGRQVIGISWIPELREAFSIQGLEAAFSNLRMLTFGGYFARPHLREIVDHIPAVEYLELVGYTLDELELLPRLSNLRRLVLTLGRPISGGSSASKAFTTSDKWIVIQDLFQKCDSLERVDFMHNRNFTHRNNKRQELYFYEKFELSSPVSAGYTQERLDTFMHHHLTGRKGSFSLPA